MESSLEPRDLASMFDELVGCADDPTLHMPHQRDESH